MSTVCAKTPVGIWAVETTLCSSSDHEKKRRGYVVWIWVLTFFVYCSYHMTRKPISVVKNVLNRNCSEVDPRPDEIIPMNDSHWCDWPPFDTDNSATLLGTLDSCFLFAYAFGMFLSGLVAERVDLRIFLSLGMILSGLFCALFGFGYTFNIHVFWFYAIVQILAGLAQSTGWPGVVAAMGNWFGKSKRGLIFGVWNSHTSIGNILGTLIASAFLTYDWGLSFIVPGIVSISLAVIVFFFLPPEPACVGLPNPNQFNEMDGVSPPPRRRRVTLRTEAYNDELSRDESSALLQTEPTVEYILTEPEANKSEVETEKAIGFLQALMIPGVIEFSISLFFSKLVSYTFLFWLPNYIFASTSYTASESANLSTFFDVGGIIGGIIAGVVSDMSGMSAVTCTIMLLVAIPMLYVYSCWGTISYGVNAAMLSFVGLLVNGPYALITTAVATELGTHHTLAGNSRALATVTGVIDGTGSIGAAVGPLIAGPISALHWNYVFYMLMASDVLALVFLTRLVLHELRTYSLRNRHFEIR